MSYYQHNEKKDCLKAAYNLSSLAINENYYCKVTGDENKATVLVLKERFFQGIVGTPSCIVVTYENKKDYLLVDVSYKKISVKKEDIVKETLATVTLLPLVSKSLQLTKMKNKIKILAIKALKGEK